MSIIPEPSSLSLFGLAFMGLVCVAKAQALSKGSSGSRHLKWRLFLSVHWLPANANMAIESSPFMKWGEKHEGFLGQRLVVLPRPILATAFQQPLLTPLLSTDAGYYSKGKGHTCVREKGGS